MSEHSAAKGSQYSAFPRMNSGGGMQQQNGMDNIDMLKYQEKYQELPLREQMLSINTLKKSENMMCLEFDYSTIADTHDDEFVDGEPVKLNEKLSIIN